MKLSLVVLLSTTLWAAAGCTQKLLPADAQPDTSPAPSGQAAGTSPGSSPSRAAQPDGLPPGHPPITVNGNGEAAATGNIEGRLDIKPELAKHVAKGDTIFIIARNSQSNAMVAVIKLAAPEKFPLPFSITPQNVMMQGTSLSGAVKLAARVDKDGDAMSKKPGDVLGELAAPVTVPAKDVTIMLDHLL